ncbi:MAG: hypothetical protein PHI79_07080 [Sulfurovaceae bacterium]|nr:hypothetical protein [Sulfurovaceae bacterium]MDD5549340.1 hypothetical protein [Sulfurovaceae bacterium]
MGNIISKKLLSEVLRTDIYQIGAGNENHVSFWTMSRDDNEKHYTTINAYELAHKCKEWAVKNNNIQLWSYIYDRGARCSLHGGNYTKYFDEESEPEVIFKACQWILDNK